MKIPFYLEKSPLERAVLQKWTYRRRTYFENLWFIQLF